MTSGNQMKLAFYADDFTGSTDALEVLTFAGLNCALFLEIPSEATLKEYGPFDAIGVAGASRAMSPAEMTEHLTPIFEQMAKLPVPFVHYKVCSTFDSSPTIGSIGKVMELARRAFSEEAIPIVAATPALARYCHFGNLFARSATDGLVHRIDRHPIMSVHPITPMHEADLRLHIGKQSKIPFASFPLPLFEHNHEAMDVELRRLVLEAKGGAVLFDGTTASHLTETGRMLDMLSIERTKTLGFSNPQPLFCVGGSGLEYAMTQWWKEKGEISSDPISIDRFNEVSQVLAVSGSASPLSELQIQAALNEGFKELRVDAAALVTGDGIKTELMRLTNSALDALQVGNSVIVHTAQGPNDPRINEMVSALVSKEAMSSESARHEGGRRLGQQLGELVDNLLQAHPLKRLLLSGGDTSSLITQRLAPTALRVAARLAPGAPLCRLISSKPYLANLEIALKGGQMGQPDYFIKALRGTS